MCCCVDNVGFDLVIDCELPVERSVDNELRDEVLESMACW